MTNWPSGVAGGAYGIGVSEALPTAVNGSVAGDSYISAGSGQKKRLCFKSLWISVFGGALPSRISLEATMHIDLIWLQSLFLLK